MANPVNSNFELPKFIMDMYKEEERLKSFKDWPFKDDCLCTAKRMAEAGFYHTPSDKEPDLVTCYVCYKEMDGWEPTDDPLSEHKNHSPKCPFVKMNKKQCEWTVEETINVEIKRKELGITKVGESVIAQLQDESQAVLDKMQNLLNC